jgi:serine/threonine protein kinase
LLLDEHGNLKISDFGLSSLYVGDADGDVTSRTELLHTTCGTPNYVAPEVLSDQGYDGKKADVWSCGVILYVLLAGFLPFDESTIVALFAKIQHADFTYPSWFSPEIRSLIDQMLVADPKLRITLANIKLHPWYMSGNPQALEVTPMAAVPATPTEAQLEAAVKPIANNSNNAKATREPIDEPDDDYEDFETTPGQHPSGPVKLNAFDVVSHCGGFMIDKMFSPEIFYKAPNEDMSKSSYQIGGSILFGGTSSSAVKSKTYQFTASNLSPTDLAKECVNALLSMNFTIEGNKDRSIASGIIKANFLSAKGMVGIALQIFILTPNLNLLTIRKGKGDLLEWNTAYSEFTEKKIGHLLNRGKGPESDVKEFY